MKRRAWRWPAIDTPAPDQRLPPWWSRLIWMAALWVASVGALLLVAALLRLVL